MKQTNLLSTFRLRALTLVTLLCTLFATQAWAEDADVTYDFTGTDWSVSDGALTDGTVSFTGEGGDNFKMNSGYFILGKSGAYINFPKYDSAVEKIVITGRSGASGKVVQNIYVGDVAVSDATTGATGTNTYEIDEDYQAAGTQYTLKVTSNYNTQITKIEIFFASSGGGGTDPVPSITANDVNIDYNATGGSIGYTLDNATGNVSASVTSGSDWLTLGTITSSSVAFTCSANTTATVRTAQVTLSFTGASNKVVTITQAAAPVPSITANDVNIDYNATGGSIGYTLDNATGNVSASVTTGSDWLTLGTITSSAVPFTCSANTTTTARTAQVTLSFTGASDKVVTVTQAAAANNISDITKNGTYTVIGTIVARSNRGFIVGDGTGYVYYYNTSYDQSTYSIGNIVKISGSVTTYGGVFEFTSAATVTTATESNYVAEDPTVITGSQMDTRVGSSDGQLSNYVQYEGTLSVSGNYYNITDINGASTAIGSISYPTSTTWSSLDGKTVRVKGYYVGVSSSKYYNTMLGSVEEVVTSTPSITLEQYEYNLNSNGGDAELPVTTSNLADDPQLAVVFVESDGETAATYDWISATINNSGNIAGHIDVNTTSYDRTAYFKVSGKDANDNTVYSELVTITQTAANPSITVEKSSIDFAFGGESDRKLSFDYESLGNDPTFEVVFFEQDGETNATYDWVTTASIEDNKVNLSVEANDGDARTAYFKVHAIGTEIYSNLVTINQAKFVVDYATLPFAFNAGRADIADTNGLTQVGLDSDYGSAPKLKFNGTGDVVVLKINEEPATLTFDIKGNSFSEGTFTVQTSSDGVNYDDLENYTELGATQSETFQLSSDVRYIKWIYTAKVNGNVALGNIVVTAPMSVNLNAYGYATFASEYALDFTTAEANGYSAWQITSIDNNAITFSQITGTVKAGTGVLLKGEVSDQVSLTRIATGGVLSDNLLVGITAPTDVTSGEYYGLSGNSFVKVGTTTIPAGKALLPASLIGGNAARLSFVFEGATTGIHSVENGQSTIENGNWYTLGGQKLNGKPATKGVYIINGKKVVIK